MRLTIDLLEKTFVFLWQSGSFYQASKQSGLTVMCFIHRVELFEKWLGKELYVRQKQQYRTAIQLTEFGYYLLCCLGNGKIYPSALLSYRHERN